MYKKLIYVPIASFLCSLLLLASCAGLKNTAPDLDPIMGEWTNDKGISVMIHRLPSKELVAEVLSAPGFFSNDLGAGQMIVKNIQPMMTSRYSGLFVMPGNEKSIRVQIRLKNINTLVFSANDKRTNGNMMVWNRVVKNDTNTTK